jgi:hypothetical protein
VATDVSCRTPLRALGEGTSEVGRDPGSRDKPIEVKVSCDDLESVRDAFCWCAAWRSAAR